MSGIDLLGAPSGGARLAAPASPELEALTGFRDRVATWYAEHVPADWRERLTDVPEEEYFDFQRWWLGELREAGFAAPHWSEEWGGGGFSLAEQIILAEEAARAGSPRLELFFTGLYHTYSTLVEAGTQEQRQRYLPKVLEGEVWCQGFSEPEAGSDLASLRTRARREGDVFVVNGQKIWSSQAAKADFCLLLARTDPDARPRKGISYFILDLHSPGVDVRPIRQITGESEFCELFLDDVEIPVENLIGAENDGWATALGTLSTERSITILDMVERLRNTTALLARDSRASTVGGTRGSAARAERMAELHTESEILTLVNGQVMQSLVASGEMNPVASVLKLFYSELLQELDDFGVELGGLDAHLVKPLTHGVRFESGDWLYDYMNAWGWTIGGGTNEIQRNVVAEQVLGLPRDPYRGS